MALSAIAMMQTAERRKSSPEPQCLCPTCGGLLGAAGSVVLSDASGEALIFGQRVKFTLAEAKVVRALMEAYPNVARYEWLKNYVYGIEADPDLIKSAQVHIVRIRRKLVGLGAHVVTHHGHGLRLGFDRPAAVRKLGRRAGRAA